MLQEIKEVLRLLMLMAKQKKKPGSENRGGLLVLVWTETDPDVHNVSCTVAAAGPWCAGIQMEELHPIFTEFMNRFFPCPGSCAEPDIEDLCAFTDLHGSLNVFLSFLMNNPDIDPAKWRYQIETFFQTFILTNAGINIHLKVRIQQNIFQQEYSVQEYIRFPLPDQQPLSLDTSFNTCHRKSFKNGTCCHGGHPDLGENIPLSVPTKTVEQGLFGTITLQSVSLLRPCVLQYPNAATNLKQIKVIMYSPSNVPVTSPSTFMQNLPACLKGQQLGVQSDCLSFQEVVPCGGTVYKVDCVDCLQTCEKPCLFSIDQSLVVFLFLQHTDPFMMDIADTMATEMLLEHHLEDILHYNKQAVANAVSNELKKTQKIQKQKKKNEEKILSACNVIVSSALSIISCSSSMEFRNTCLRSMRVHTTVQLSEAISEAFRRIIFCKFVPKRSCHSDQIEQQLESYKRTRVEM